MTALDALLTAGEASALLGVTDRQIRALAADGKIPKAGRGQYRLGDLVPAYLATLAAERQRQAGGVVETDFRKMRTAELAARLDERTGRLEAEAQAVALSVIDQAGGALLAALSAVPARVTRDLSIRSRIEQEIDLALHHVADRLEAAADRAKPAGEPAPPPARADPGRVGRREPRVRAERRPPGSP